MAQQDDRRQAVAGVLFALAAFGLWGINPVYFKAVDHVPELEVLAHRVVWTVALLAGLVTATGGWATVARALRDRQTLAMLGLSTALISVNWFIYIWAVAAERVLETSLGYFINPLISESNVKIPSAAQMQRKVTRWARVKGSPKAKMASRN